MNSSAAKIVAVLLLCCGAFFMLGFCAAHISFTVRVTSGRIVEATLPALVVPLIPAYVAVLSYAVAVGLGLVQAFSTPRRCATIINILVDAVFLLTAGAAAIIAITAVANNSVASALIRRPPDFTFIGPAVAEMVFIVIAVGFYVVSMCFRVFFIEAQAMEQSTELKSY